MNRSIWSRVFYLAAALWGSSSLPGEETMSSGRIGKNAPPFTGSLIAPMGTAVPYRSAIVKSYLYFMAHTGSYGSNWESSPAEENFYTLNVRILSFLGLTSWCDINLAPSFLYNRTSNEHCLYFGDLSAGLDFQLMPPDLTPYFPGIKFGVKEIFPTGNFEWFSPKKLSTDQTGGGSFATQFDLVFYKLFHLKGIYWLSSTFSAQYTIHTPSSVHGFNSYGGGFGANGTILPGNIFEAIISFEITLTENWVFALDNVYRHTDKTRFFGLPGISFAGTFADIGKPSSEQLSFAPALEYDISSSFRIIGGCWLSGWGRNSPQFRSGVINLEYVY